MRYPDKPEHTDSNPDAPKHFRDRMRDHPVWKTVVWLAGAADVSAMAIQFKRIWETQNTDGISVAMFEIFLAIQLVFAFEGWCRRSTAQFASLLMQAGATTAIIGEILYIRNQLPTLPH